MPPKGSRGGVVPSPSPVPVGPARPPAALSPIISLLRQDWRFAAISAFCSSFLLRLTGLEFDVEALETDLDTTEDQVLPDLMWKLLYSLTFNTHINASNWQDHLLRQYLKRSPDTNQLGTLDEPRPWAELGLGDKVAAIHDLCEWQMVDPTRFRGLVIDENLEVEAAWRKDPVGYDRDGNAYYVFLDNRLWKQHAPPAPPRPVQVPRDPTLSPPPSPASSDKGKGKATSPVKAKSTSAKPVRASHKKRIIEPTDDEDAEAEDEPVEPSTSSSRRKKQSAPESPPSSSRRASSSRNAASSSTPAKKARTSRRSRGEDDMWQEIPEEWLSPAKSDGEDPAKLKGTGLVSEEGSDLSDLSEDELSDLSDADEDAHPPDDEVAKGVVEDKVEAAEQEEVLPESEPKEDPVEVEDKTDDQDAPMADADGAAEDPILEQRQEAAHGLPDHDAVSSPKVKAGSAVPDEDRKVQFAEDGDLPADPGADATMVDADGPSTDVDAKVEPEEDEEDEVQVAKRFVPSYIEWEAVCTCRWEWENYPLKWSSSDDPDEKALFEVLIIDYLPFVTEYYKEVEQRVTEVAAVKARKRSSRLQAVEDERAEIERTRAARDGMESRMDKVRREEDRKAREIEERNQRERQREEKLREREERALQREETLRLQKEEEEAEKIREAERREERTRMKNGEIPMALLSDDKPAPAQASSSAKKANGNAHGAAKPKKASASKKAVVEVEEDWILNCELCGTYAKNPADDSDLLCCEQCNEWQHMGCWDKKDAAERRPRRNWEREDFKCSKCLKKAGKKPRKSDPSKAKGAAPAKKAAASAKASTSAKTATPSKAPAQKSATPKSAPQAKAKVVPPPQTNGHPPLPPSQPPHQPPAHHVPQHAPAYPPQHHYPLQPPPSHYGSHASPPQPVHSNGHQPQHPVHPSDYRQHPSSSYPPPMSQPSQSYPAPYSTGPHRTSPPSNAYVPYSDRGAPPPPPHLYSPPQHQANGHRPPSLPPISALQQGLPSHQHQPHLPPISYPGSGPEYYSPGPGPSAGFALPPMGTLPRRESASSIGSGGGHVLPLLAFPPPAGMRRESWDGRAE